MSDANGNPCLEIGPVCTLDKTTYGYYPSLPANAFFAAAFGAFLVVQLYQGLKWKSWTYLVALGFGCLGEVIGKRTTSTSFIVNSQLTSKRPRRKNFIAQQSLVEHWLRNANHMLNYFSCQPTSPH